MGNQKKNSKPIIFPEIESVNQKSFIDKKYNNKRVSESNVVLIKKEEAKLKIYNIDFQSHTE